MVIVIGGRIFIFNEVGRCRGTTDGGWKAEHPVVDVAKLVVWTLRSVVPDYWARQKRKN
jgi:hypothetical protein